MVSDEDMTDQLLASNTDMPKDSVSQLMKAESGSSIEKTAQVSGNVTGTLITGDVTINYIMGFPEDWRDQLKIKLQSILEESSNPDFQRLCIDIIGQKGYHLPKDARGLDFGDSTQFLTVNETAARQLMRVVKCVHKPLKTMDDGDVNEIIQSLKSREDQLALDGYWIITSGYWAEEIESTFKTQFPGKKFKPLDIRDIGKILQEAPELGKKYTGIQVPSEAMSEFTRNYEFLNDRLFDQDYSVDAEVFYKGNSANWGVIINGLDFRRDVKIVEGQTERRCPYHQLFERVIQLSDERQKGLSFILLTAEAGSGKTTLLHRLGYDLYCQQGEYDRYFVVRVKSGAPLHLDPLVEFSRHVKKHLYILIDINDVEVYKDDLKSISHELSMKNLPVTIIATARYNEWARIGGEDHIITARKKIRVWLGRVSEREANDLLDLLQKHEQLGDLKDHSRDIQLQRFLSPAAADKQLIVALMEATHGDNFENILKSEFNNLKPEIVQRAYGFVCLFHTYDILLPIGLLTKILELDKEMSFYEQVLEQAPRVIIRDFDRTHCVRTRHRQIATVLKTSLSQLKDEYYLELMLSEIISCVNEWMITERYAILKFLLSFVSGPEKFAKTLITQILIKNKDKINAIRSQIKDSEERYIELAEWGYLYYKLGDLEMDRAFLSDALEIAPAGNEAAKICYYYGKVSEDLGYEHNAKEYFQRAYQWDLRIKEFLHRYLQFEIDNNNFKNAFEIIEETLAQNLDNNVIRRFVYGLLGQLIAEGSYDEAIQLCKIGLKSHNDNMSRRMQYKLAYILEQRNQPNDWPAALREYDKVIKQEPNHIMAMSRSASILARSTPENYAKAEALYKKAISLHEPQDNLWAQLRSDYALLLVKFADVVISRTSTANQSGFSYRLAQRYFDKAKVLWRDAAKKNSRLVVYSLFEVCDYYSVQVVNLEKARQYLISARNLIKQEGLTDDEKILQRDTELWELVK